MKALHGAGKEKNESRADAQIALVSQYCLVVYRGERGTMTRG